MVRLSNTKNAELTEKKEGIGFCLFSFFLAKKLAYIFSLPTAKCCIIKASKQRRIEMRNFKIDIESIGNGVECMLTPIGERKVRFYLREMAAKRKEILDAGVNYPHL